MLTIDGFDSELQARRVLEAEGKRLLKIARKVWQSYLDSYKPQQYVRKGKAMDSIKLGVVKKIEDDMLGIELTFQDDLVYHNSVISEDQPKGHAIMLISNGWRVKNGWHKDIPRFGYYEGFDYLGKVVEEFEKDRHKGISIEVQWSGKYLKE